MLLGESRRRYPTQTAVGPHLVEVAAPFSNGHSGLVQRLEPLLVEALVAELAVEALDEPILRRLARCDQDVAHAATRGPGHECLTGEFRSVVGSDGCGVAAESRGLVEQARHVGARNAVVDRNVHTFMAEVVGHGQALQPSAVGQTVADKIHAPHLVDRFGQLQRHALGRRAPDLLALAHSQVGLAVQPIHPLMVDARKCGAQQVVDAPIPEPPPDMRDLNDLAVQCRVERILLGRMAIAISAEPHEAARSALGQMMLADHLANGLAFDPWG